MKTILLFCLALFLTGFGMAQSPIVINSTDVAAIGDTVLRAVDTLWTLPAGTAGANQTWDFSSAVDRELVETRAISPSGTQNAGNFPGSNLAMTNDNLNYLYFNINTDSLELLGLAGELLGNGNNVSTEFNPAVTVNHFPMTYGNTASDNYFFDETTSGSGFDILFGFSVDKIRLQHTGYTTDTVDAWGTIKTPYGTYEVLRNKHVEISDDVIMYKIFSFSPWATLGNYHSTAVSYGWSGKESGLAIVELAYDSLGSPDRVTYYREGPQADFSLVNSGLGMVSFNDLSTGKVDTWSWDFGDGSPLDNSQNPMYTYTVNGTYTVCLTVTNSAGIASHCDTVTITDAVGMKEQLAQHFEVFPNPAKNNVQFKFDAKHAGKSAFIRLMDLSGRTIFTKKRILNSSGQADLELRNFAKGLHFYEIELNGKFHNGKLLIED